MTPGRLAHLQAEVAANDRWLRTYWPTNTPTEALRQAIRRDRKMRNAGLRQNNATNPAWDWLSGWRLSGVPKAWQLAGKPV